MSRSRLWIFRIITIVFVPTLFFLLLEAGLRMLDYGYESDFTISASGEGDPASFRDNEQFSWRFFVRSMARHPKPFKAAVEKAPNSYRIALLGASAAQGDPDDRFGVARFLEAQLRHHYPDIRFEVINTAITATNSHVVLETVRDMAERDVDMFVVYLGNNEVVGPFGAGTAFAPYASSLAVIRATIALQSTRTGQLIDSIAKGAILDAAPQPEWLGMEMMVDNQVRASDAKLEKVYRHFEANLADIVSIAAEDGAPVLLSTVATNLRDSPPFGSLNRADLDDAELAAWREHYDTGVERESRGDCAGALESFRAAGKIDETHADLNFRIARCAAILGDTKTSGAHYVNAREQDVLRFRADTKINEIIRSVATTFRSAGVHLVDAEQAFGRRSPMQLPGNEFFLEHVHFNDRGTHLLALTLLEKIHELLPDSVRESRRHTEPMPLERVRAVVGYTEFAEYLIHSDIHGRFQTPPFTNQIYANERLVSHARRLVEIRKRAFSPDTVRRLDARYRRLTDSYPANPWLRSLYADFLVAVGRHEKATEQFESALEIFPHSYSWHESLARSLLSSGRYTDAEAQARRTLGIRPLSHPAKMTLAWSLAKQERMSEARELFDELIERFPSRAGGTYVELGQALVEAGKHAEALQALQKSLDSEMEPGRHQVMAAYLMTRISRELFEKSAETVVTGALAQLDKNPQFAAFHASLGTIYQEQGRLSDAIEKFSEAVELDPGMSRLYFNLVNLLVKQDRLEDAVAIARRATEAMDVLNRAELAERFRQATERLQSRATDTAN